jgi:ABC-type transport system involved in cytochrome c biogenesis permease subunit
MRKQLPILVLFLAIIAVLASLRPPSNPGEYDVVGFGRLPVLVNGRTKPYDTVARTSLLYIQNRQAVRTPDGRRLQPIEWLLDVFFKPETADTYQVFLIDDPDLLALLGLRREDGLGNRRFAFTQMSDRLAEIQRQAELAGPVEPVTRNRFQKAVVELRGRLVLYQQLKHSLVPPDLADPLGSLMRLEEIVPQGIAAAQARQAGQAHDEALVEQMLDFAGRFATMQEFSHLLAIPPDTGADPTAWKGAGTALTEVFQAGRIHPYALVFAGMAQTWRSGPPDRFNGIVERYSGLLSDQLENRIGRVRLEAHFNAAAPFLTGMVLFALAGLGGVLSWLVWPEAIRKSVFALVAIGWVLTTVGILTRMWLEGRPPVTNLYSSALYVGWGAVALCLVLEWFFKNAIGSVAAGAIGFVALLIAHHLSFAGDTLEMMQAVLDSNFWLATHVVMITTGYSATFLAGFLALIYVIRGVFTRSLDGPTANALSRMVYGIVCFATLFSLIGTVLGGIWADQSWGRFWGWDPKENGALMIVIWNAVILHARWGGMAKARGIMALAIFGNIITAWSWFGVNMLGVGLHSYGFTDAAFLWLSVFILTQLSAIAVAMVPTERWKSFAAPTANA